MKKVLGSTRFWIGCFVGLILISAGFLMYRNASAGGVVAVVTRDGQELQRIDLDQVTEAYTLRMEHPDGGYNLIQVQHGKISVTEASCPDKVCINQGSISDSLTPIVCLPNKVMIAIEDTGNDLAVDVAVK